MWEHFLMNLKIELIINGSILLFFLILIAICGYFEYRKKRNK